MNDFHGIAALWVSSNISCFYGKRVSTHCTALEAPRFPGYFPSFSPFSKLDSGRKGLFSRAQTLKYSNFFQVVNRQLQLPPPVWLPKNETWLVTFRYLPFKTFTAYFVDFLVFPGTSSLTSFFISLPLPSAKRLSFFLHGKSKGFDPNFDSFVSLLCSKKSDDGYQIGWWVSPDTRLPISYHVMCFNQWPHSKINRWVINIDIRFSWLLQLFMLTELLTFFLNETKKNPRGEKAFKTIHRFGFLVNSKGLFFFFFFFFLVSSLKYVILFACLGGHSAQFQTSQSKVLFYNYGPQYPRSSWTFLWSILRPKYQRCHATKCNTKAYRNTIHYEM